MDTNLLLALTNLVKSGFLISDHSTKSSNRMNNMGESLEMFVKDIFCNSLGENDLKKKKQIYEEYFSYTGNQNNPPDIMIKLGDAIEVKKIESNGNTVALNSSYPKNKLFSNSPMITKACRDCEKWTQKDMLYVIGNLREDQIKSLWFIYGDCFAADKEIYERIKNRISIGLEDLSGVELSQTNEIGRINKVDPLGITNLRIRGMWQIDHPSKIFGYLSSGVNDESEFNLNVLI